MDIVALPIYDFLMKLNSFGSNIIDSALLKWVAINFLTACINITADIIHYNVQDTNNQCRSLKGVRSYP